VVLISVLLKDEYSTAKALGSHPKGQLKGRMEKPDGSSSYRKSDDCAICR
jgi:hypothetical protein